MVIAEIASNLKARLLTQHQEELAQQQETAEDLVERLAQFGQQPRILDSDDRLVGKGAHQLDLPLCERLDPQAHQHNDPDRQGWGESVERSSARTVQLDSEPTQSCRGSDGSFAPIPVAPEATIEPRGSSLLGHSASHSEWLFLPHNSH